MDAYVSEIVAVIDQNHADKLDEMVAQMKAHGMDVTKVNDSEAVIEGTIESYKLKEIDAIPGVEYVRTVFTYAADYARGDPRDIDGV